MISPLENLCGPGKSLRQEPPDAKEFAGLKHSGRTRLADAQNPGIALESRFDLAYNAAHALCLAALRRIGYRATNRYIVFQVLPHTLGLGAAVWGVLAKCALALKPDIFGNREFLNYLRGRKTFYYKPENRELDLVMIDFANPENNIYEVTEEFYYHNGRHGNREDVVFLINGIPVLVIECKNATKDEAIALGIDQLRRYHDETPELLQPQQIITATEAIGFAYGVTWNTVRRNIFNWKDEHIGQLESKIKSFCAIANVLAFLKDYIIFTEKDEELSKFIFRQHQKEAAECVVRRAHEAGRRGLVWNTQGSGKTFTMIKAAELLFKAPASNKPTILLLIDRNELEDQMLRNLAALGLANVEQATSIARLNELIKSDYRGIIVTTIQKFRDMPANLNARDNIYVLIDEAHRTTQGDLGNYLMAGLPNATFIGFTGTPIDQTAYGKGTFKTFGADDAPQGYLRVCVPPLGGTLNCVPWYPVINAKLPPHPSSAVNLQSVRRPR